MKVALIGYEANIKKRVGSNQYAFELIKAIYQFNKENHYTVYLPSPPLPDLPKKRKNWQYRVVGPRKLWNIFGLPRALFQQKPRPNLVFNPGHYSPIYSPAPPLVSIMDLGYIRFPQHFTKRIYWKLRFWTGLSIRRARHVFTISESTKNDIIKYYRVNPKKITVTYPGYDKDKFRYQISKIKIERAKKKYKIEGDYLLFLSTLKPNKNIEGLLEAFKRLEAKGLNLVITGRKGWLFQSIFDKVKKLGLENKVIFTGFINENDVPALMKGAKAFVMPSFWEGFGIPVVEAMAVGTPVVVSNAGSLPEIVGKAGIIINPYNTEEITKGIKEAIENRDNLIEKGLKQAKKFSWGKCAKKTIKVLERIGGR